MKLHLLCHLSVSVFILFAAYIQAQEPETPGKKETETAPPSTTEKKAPSIDDIIADLRQGGEKRMEALNYILSQGVRDKALLQPLLDVAGDDTEANKEARPLAFRALINLRGMGLTSVEKDALTRTLVAGLTDDDPQMQAVAIAGIGAADTAAEPALLKVAEGKDAPLRVMAFQRLALIWANRLPEPRKGPPPAPMALLKALDDEDSEVRTAASMAFWAGGYKDKAAIGPLLKIFSDKAEANAQGRAHALHALVRVRSGAHLTPEEEKQVLEAMQVGVKDFDPDVRYYALWGIQRTDKAFLPLVEEAVKDTNPKVRAIAHEKLYMLRGFTAPAQTGQGKAPPELLAGLNDKDQRVRSEAVRAFWLGGYKDVDALPPLLTVLADKEEANRIARLDALRALNNLRTAPLSDDIKTQITKAIISALQDPYFAVRYQAAKCITASDTSALPVLQEAAKDDNPMVQAAVREALQRLEKNETPK